MTIDDLFDDPSDASDPSDAVTRAIPVAAQYSRALHAHVALDAYVSPRVRVVRAVAPLTLRRSAGDSTQRRVRPARTTSPARLRLQCFRPLPKVVASTRRKPLIRWQKRAAAWEHGFESRWGHQIASGTGIAE